MRAVWAAAAFSMLSLPAPAHGEPPPASLRERIDDELTAMELQGSAYDPRGLHELSAAGLVGVLDHFFPDTAVVAVEARPAEDEIKRLIGQLGNDDFRIREAATAQLIARARPCRELLVQATDSDDAEVRLRTQRILAAWEPKAGNGGDRGLGGLWNYLEKIRDGERLDVLARRVAAEFARGYPEGRKLHHLRLCVAGLAKGANEASCEHLRPLVASQDVRIAKFITETVGSYKADEAFFPPLLLDALASERDEVVQVAIRWAGNCRHSPRAGEVRAALRAVFERRDDALKFQSCLPLVQEFDDPQAWRYVIEQTQSKAPLRAAAALSSLADAKFTGREASPELIAALAEPLASSELSLRWGATKALGTHGGTAVIKRLVALLGDSEPSVRDEATRCLLKQSDKRTVRDELDLASRRSENKDLRRHAAEVLHKFDGE
jgi:hypothetical protein